jgi:hypothetical protein
MQAAQKGLVIPANHIDNKEKMLIKVATQGGNVLFAYDSVFYYVI